MIACMHVVRALTLGPGTAREIGRRVMLGENRAREALTELVRCGAVSRSAVKFYQKKPSPMVYALRS